LPETTTADESTAEQSELSANRFDIDIEEADDRAEQLADQHAEEAARLWGTPEGEWWP
jgi:hypothetical protein